MIRKKRMSKGIAKILSGLLVFGMVAGIVPAVPGGTVHAKAEGESEPGVTAVENPEHKHCVCGTGEHPNDGKSHNVVTWTGIENYEELKNITADGYYYLEKDVEIDNVWKCPNGVTLCLNGHNIIRKSVNHGEYPSDNAVIYITGKFTLTNCKEEGSIKHVDKNYGVGIWINGDFNMYKGNISNNNGGVINYGIGTFCMFGGTISGNSTNCGGGVYIHQQGTFLMYGGLISGNTADYGGGVYNRNIFNMSGGEITDNTTTKHGGGVYNAGDAFTMSGGTITQNESQWNGGGVYNYNSTFEMSGGAITGNETKRFGGGVHNELKTTFNMSGTAEISNNKATTNVGGVYAWTDSKITLSDAVKITGNTVGEIANNLFIVSPSNLYAQSLADGAKIGVTANDTPIGDSTVTITNDVTKAEYFESDNSDYEIGTNPTTDQIVLKCKEKLPTVPNPVPNRFTYDGTEHAGIELGDKYIVTGGTYNATDAGTHKVSVKPSDGKTWEDGTTTEKQLEWIIEKASQNAPTGLVGEKTITAGGSDGKITGVNEQMEY